MPTQTLCSHHVAWRRHCAKLLVLALFWAWFVTPLIPAPAANDGPWVQVCTSLGTKFVQIDLADGKPASQDNKPTYTSSADCPYCCSQLGTGLISSPATASPFTGNPYIVPFAPTAQYVPSDPSRLLAEPRAPPLTTSI